jgi:hypothetical protein
MRLDSKQILAKSKMQKRKIFYFPPKSYNLRRFRLCANNRNGIAY